MQPKNAFAERNIAFRIISSKHVGDTVTYYVEAYNVDTKEQLAYTSFYITMKDLAMNPNAEDYIAYRYTKCIKELKRKLGA